MTEKNRNTERSGTTKVEFGKGGHNEGQAFSKKSE